MNNLNSTLIPRENLKEVLPFVLPWLEKTINEATWTTWSVEDVVEGLNSGRYLLWGVGKETKNLFVMTELVQEKLGQSVHIVLGGGQIYPESVDHISLIENYAKQIGATSVVVIGRLGWRKFLAKNGYEFEAASFRRILKDKMQ